MNLKPAALMGLGAVFGIAIATLVHRAWNPATMPAVPDGVARQPAQPVPRLVAAAQLVLPSPAAIARQEAVPSRVTLPPTDSRVMAIATRRDVQKLLAAGFTLERAEWILKRKEELAEQRRTEASRPDPYSARYMLDPDLDLREEMSPREYEQLRLATGRPLTVDITGVLPGGNAAAAGLKDGDEIVAYGGKRVFNFFDLQKQAAESSSGSAVVIDFKRDGQALQVSVPAGPLGLRNQSVFTIFDTRMDASRRQQAPQ